jgi:hypothetical protein
MAYTCHLSYTGSLKRSLGRKVRPYPKNDYSKVGWGMAQVVKHLPSKQIQTPKLAQKKKKTYGSSSRQWL